MNEILNRLPALTWRHLHVNEAPEAAALPELPAPLPPSNTSVGELPGGAVLAAERRPVLDTLVSGAGADFDAFAAKNANFRLDVAAEYPEERPLLIEHTLDEAHPWAAAHLTIYARAGSSLTVAEVLRGNATGGVHASLTRIYAEAGARVRLLQVFLPGEDVRSWSGVAAEAAEDASVEVCRAVLGGSLALAGAQCLLPERRGAFTVRTAFYGAGDALLDFSDTAVHTGQGTVSEIHAAGVLTDRCQKTLRGAIDFRRGAVHAVGHESEDVLLLSPEVRNRSVPLILCGEEQVEGQHAASAGRLDQQLLYYMAARGLDEIQTKRLMVQAKLAPVLDQLPAALQLEAAGFVERRLGL